MSIASHATFGSSDTRHGRQKCFPIQRSELPEWPQVPALLTSQSVVFPATPELSNIPVGSSFSLQGRRKRRRKEPPGKGDSNQFI